MLFAVRHFDQEKAFLEETRSNGRSGKMDDQSNLHNPASQQVTGKSPARKPNKYGHAMANKSATNILLKLFLIVSETTIHLTRSVYV